MANQSRTLLPKLLPNWTIRAATGQYLVVPGSENHQTKQHRAQLTATEQTRDDRIRKPLLYPAELRDLL